LTSLRRNATIESVGSSTHRRRKTERCRG
jgi:hypothetical protein